MSNEKVLLVGGKDSAKLDQPLRELGCDVSRVETFASAEGLQDFRLVIADAKALKECAEESPWPVKGHGKNPALVVSLHGNEEIPEWARRHIAGCLAQEVSRGHLSIVLQAVDARRRQQAFASRAVLAGDDAELVGGSEGAERLRQAVRNLSRTNATVLIRGDSGTDRTGVAVALHRQSPRADEILWQADCTMATEAVEAELFGVSGEKEREGALKLAQGGSLILHEVGQLSAAGQDKLMQFLEGGRGGDDVRLLSTTSDDLETRCKIGAFREDLFLRLNLGPVCLSALRERKSDLRELAEHLSRRIGSRHGADTVAFSPAAYEALESYAWPGNMAELRHVIGRAVILAAGERVIEPAHLRLEAGSAAGIGGQEDIATLPLAELERQHIFRVLEHCQWNRTHAAVKLGISIRTLRNKLREYRMATADAA